MLSTEISRAINAESDSADPVLPRSLLTQVAAQVEVTIASARQQAIEQIIAKGVKRLQSC